MAKYRRVEGAKYFEATDGPHTDRSRSWDREANQWHVFCWSGNWSIALSFYK